ncbi:MAG: peptidoglycan-binding protein [bacterium]|nr:peptidoglycan-binding protein [bacterium]
MKNKSLIAVVLVLGLLVAAAPAKVQAQNSNSAVVEFNSNLQIGSRGALVEFLQALLASDPTLGYTGGVTSYFGPQTAKAVQKLQANNGLSKVGKVGPQTRALLNKKLATAPVTVEVNAQGVECVKVPPGHLIAPGLKKKQGYVAPTVPSCQTLPPGIMKKLGLGGGNNGGGNNDTTAPVISNLAVGGISTTSTLVNFNTNENAVYEVSYGPTTAYGTTSTKTTVFGMNHSKLITGLTVNTLYHYQVKAFDQAGNSVVSADGTFTTLATDAIAPVVSAVTITGINHNSVVINWTTNEASNSEVNYGATVAYGSSATVDAGLVVNHSRTLSGLSANTLYHFQVVSKDASNNSGMSADMTFTTLVAPDVIAPLISGAVVNSITATGGTVQFTTNESATAKVYYSLVSPVNKATALSVSGTANTTHSLNLTGLTANIPYYYLIEVTDTAANVITNTQASFSTLAV